MVVPTAPVASLLSKVVSLPIATLSVPPIPDMKRDYKATALHRSSGIGRRGASLSPRGGTAMKDLLVDLRYGLRTLLRNRGFAIVAVLTLGLGLASGDWKLIVRTFGLLVVASVIARPSLNL